MKKYFVGNLIAYVFVMGCWLMLIFEIKSARNEAHQLEKQLEECNNNTKKLNSKPAMDLECK